MLRARFEVRRLAALCLELPSVILRFTLLDFSYMSTAALALHPAGLAHRLAYIVCPFVQIYVVFELGSFFQNFRRYVRSYDPTRMHDGSGSGSPVSACAPFAYIDPGNNTLPINPCGQIAQSFFNDTFSLSLAGGGDLPVDDSDIAWSSDANHLYGPVSAENYNPGGGYPRGGNTTDVVLNQNQHWMVRWA